MREIRRSSVLIERCVSCGGVFLDPGELEHLVEGERSYYEQEPRRVEQRAGRRDDDDYDDDDRYDDDRGYGRRRKSRKRSFIEELLDFD